MIKKKKNKKHDCPTKAKNTLGRYVVIQAFYAQLSLYSADNFEFQMPHVF